MQRIKDREQYIRKLALKTLLENISDEDVKYILENVDISSVEAFLRKKKLEKINSDKK